MPVVLLSIFVSLLPQRYRGHYLADANIDVKRGAILSGAVQFVACGALIWALYPAFSRQHIAELSASITASGHAGDKVVEGMSMFAYGPIMVVAYLVRPLTLVLLYFMLEGVVRLTAAVAADQVIPTLSLQLVAWAHDLGKARYHEFELGPRIADLIEPGVAGKYDLKVLSCRPKDWNPLVTIRFQDQMYELQSQETGSSPRPFVYLLRFRPEGKVVRGLRDYDPTEPLHQPGWAEVAGTPRK